jgi:hypothetical protein
LNCLSCDINKIVVAWSTASEINNDFFTIEKSFDGVNYKTLTTLKGAGNSNMYTAYSVSDNNPSSGIIYYRLKQTNNDGSFKYLAVKSINCLQSILDGPTLFSYPNPFNDIVNFEVSNLNADNFTIKITNVLGNIIETKEMKNLQDSKAAFSFDMSKYKIGIYYYQFSSGSFVKTGKFIKN